MTFFSRMCCRWCRVRRRADEYESTIAINSMHNNNNSNNIPTVRQDHVGKERYMPTDMVMINQNHKSIISWNMDF